MAGKLLERLGLARVHEVVRAQRAGVRLFGRRSGERRNLSSKSMGKLNCHVPQTADADDALLAKPD